MRFHPVRILVLAVLALVVVATGAEAWLRISVGDHPLFRPHPTIEYENAPDQSVVYRGMRYETNSLGLRGPDIEATKPDDVFRLLVIGDGVVFGDLNTDQSELATTHLSSLSTKAGKRVEAVNVSANGWGPGNMLAWLEAHGDLDADYAVVVLSTADLDDDRDFAPLPAPDKPISRAPVALMNLVQGIARDPGDGAAGSDGRRIEGDARASIPLLLDRTASLPRSACLIVHETTDERAEAAPSEAARELAGSAQAKRIPVVSTRDYVPLARGYEDSVHLSAWGQRALAQAILSCPLMQREGVAVHPLPTGSER
ncbi:MAG: hypothetical protein R3C52_11500 [Hyphomonadaceae bacterium]